MIKAELQKSHDAMAKFLVHLCRFSDVRLGGCRTVTVEGHYQKALRLIKRAGFKYSDPKNRNPRSK